MTCSAASKIDSLARRFEETPSKLARVRLLVQRHEFTLGQVAEPGFLPPSELPRASLDLFDNIGQLMTVARWAPAKKLDDFPVSNRLRGCASKTAVPLEQHLYLVDQTYLEHPFHTSFNPMVQH